MYPNSIFELFFAAQGYALFEYLGEGGFRLIGSWPAWCEDLWGAQPVGERIIRLGDKSPFLDNFIFEAGEFWNSQARDHSIPAIGSSVATPRKKRPLKPPRTCSMENRY